jgi:hypothetical protein
VHSTRLKHKFFQSNAGQIVLDFCEGTHGGDDDDQRRAAAGGRFTVNTLANKKGEISRGRRCVSLVFRRPPSPFAAHRRPEVGHRRISNLFSIQYLGRSCSRLVRCS